MSKQSKLFSKLFFAFFILLFFSSNKTYAANEVPEITYSIHQAYNHGPNGTIYGKNGQIINANCPIDKITIKTSTGHVKYKVYTRKFGWGPTKADGATAGNPDTEILAIKAESMVRLLQN